MVNAVYKSVCNCLNVKAGDYSNQRTLPIPAHMKDYKEARKAAGLSNLISVDKCCIPELVELWSNGVTTVGCCCGHGIVSGMINIKPSDFERAIELGFTKYIFKDSNGGDARCDTVNWPKFK